MGIYGTAAVFAVQTCQKVPNLSPEDAWEIAIKEQTASSASQNKGCPRATFLGLCKSGRISGIAGYPGERQLSKNAEYAIKALDLLKQNSKYSLNKQLLWEHMHLLEDKHEIPKNQNGQLDVVISLWEKGFIIYK